MLARGDPGAVDVLAACTLFAALGRDELALLAGVASVHRFPARAAIFVERQPPSGLWVLAEGSVKLHHSAPDRREHIVRLTAAHAPSPLQLWAALDGRPLTATATTLGPVTALFLPGADFASLLERRPAVAQAVMQHLCTELRVREIGGGVGALKGARERLACRLVQFTRQFGAAAPGGVRIAQRLTRHDLAASAGVTVETAIRAVSRWRAGGLLSTEDHEVEIHDLPGLRQVAGCDQCLYDCSVFGPSLDSLPPESAS